MTGDIAKAILRNATMTSNAGPFLRTRQEGWEMATDSLAIDLRTMVLPILCGMPAPVFRTSIQTRSYRSIAGTARCREPVFSA